MYAKLDRCPYSGKVGHKTRAGAESQRQRMMTSRAYDGEPLAAYQCGRCGRYHIGHAVRPGLALSAKIGRGSVQPGCVVPKHPNTPVARLAEQPANAAGSVVMVNGKRHLPRGSGGFTRATTANRTHAALIRKSGSILNDTDTVAGTARRLAGALPVTWDTL